MQRETESRKRDGEAGFTLVETLVAIVVLVFGLIAVTNLLLVGATQQHRREPGHGRDHRGHASRWRSSRRGRSGTWRPVATWPPTCPCFSDNVGVDGVGFINVRWQIEQPEPQLRFISVQAEGVAPLVRVALAGPADDVPLLHRRNCGMPRAMTRSSAGRPEGGGLNMTEERQGGFSLIELLVAMTITLIVSGAIYGLLTGGQNAFRREPELTERQQNIRLAMDMIMRDTANAGVGLPPFAQLFTTGLDDDASSPPGPSGNQSDEIEMLTNTGQEAENTCAATRNHDGAWGETNVFLTRELVGSVGVGRLVFLILSEDMNTAADDYWTTRRVTAQPAPEAYPAGTTGLVPPNCSEDTPGVPSIHATLDFANGPGNMPSLCALAPVGSPRGNIDVTRCGSLAITRVVFANQVRYRIRNAPDGVPVLQRASTEDPAGTFQTLARGIEELQVQYTQVTDPATWVDDAPLVAAPDGVPPVPDTNYGTLINQIRVTLTARSEARDLQGATH